MGVRKGGTASSNDAKDEDSKETKSKDKKVKEEVKNEPEVKVEEVPFEAPPADENTEKRAKPFRRFATADITARINRALTQRLYLINQSDISTPESKGRKYAVLGSTGNVYDIEFCKSSTCSCPDFGRSRLCKHILFVTLKVLRVAADSPLVYQDALLQSELTEIFAAAPAPLGDIQAKAEVVSAYKKLIGGESSNEETPSAPTTQEEAPAPAADEKQPEGDCPVCFEDLPNGEPLDSCLTCRNFIHVDCLKMWLGRSKTCCYCRCDWKSKNAPPDPPTPKKANMSYEGYTNLAAIQGMSTKRDTSTYARKAYVRKQPAKRRRRSDWEDEDEEEEDDGGDY